MTDDDGSTAPPPAAGGESGPSAGAGPPETVDATPERVAAAAEERLATLADEVPFAESAPDLDPGFFGLDHLEAAPVTDAAWVNLPFAHVALLWDETEGRHRYRVAEPTLDEFERHVRDDLAGVARSELVAGGDPDETDVRDELARVVAEYGETLSPATRFAVHYHLQRDLAGFGPIDPLMEDPDVEDVHCDGADVPLYVYHRDHGNLETGVTIGGDDLDSLAVRLAQRADRHLSTARPLLTDTLPDGSRIQVTLGADVGSRGSNFTVRKFRERPFTPPELADLRTFTLDQLTYLWLAAAHNRSVLFVGPTASGKTTSMNVVAMFVPPDHKVVSVEETRELRLPHDNWVAEVTRESALAESRPDVGMYDLLSEALHQRPDHVVVGEMRLDPEVVGAFFQALGTGHEGFTTFHAESPRDALRRLRHDPLSVPDALVTDVDVVVSQRLLTVGGEKVRRCDRITEIRDDPDAADPRPVRHPVFDYDPQDDAFSQVAPAHLPREIADGEGWSDDRLDAAIRRRKRLLADMVAESQFDYDAVTRRLFRFARDPEAALAGVDGGPVEPIDVHD